MRTITAAFATTIAIVVAAPALSAVEIGQRVPDFRLTNSNGEDIQLSQFAGRTVVLEWNNPGCPYVQRHYGSGNMQATQRAARARDVVWLTINSGAPGKQGHMRGSEANEFVADHDGAPSQYLLDPRGVVGRAYDARTTPHMFILDGNRVLRYDGAIDDAPHASEAETGDARNYVLAALEDMRANRAVRTSTSRPYGCSVKYSDEAD